MLRKYKPIALMAALMLSLSAGAQAQQTSGQAPQPNATVSWDATSLILNGHRVTPVMGEIHYSRLPEAEWQQAVTRMKNGGVTIIACYVFWNHIEELEDQFDWSGQRNLRRFLEICQQQELPVILRIGPFCHGEARNGGIPDWVFTKDLTPRSRDPRFLELTRKLYRQIYTQVDGLLWKDGGPIIAAQMDNEWGGEAEYLQDLKKVALQTGFDLPFYTRTGWPELSTPMPYGEMLPLYGDYADGFWDRSTEETAGEYWQAFHFKPTRTNETIGSEQIDYTTKKVVTNAQAYPYFTCELGGGMMTSYQRRVYLYPEDAYSMATVKLGSGSNLLGYYMYHGGTNPEGKTSYLNETQKTVSTNYNDLPVKTYDFQAPLGEFGQTYPHYYSLRRLHLFMQDFGELLAPMTAVYPDDAVLKKGDDSRLRWSYRSRDNLGFVFVNNYERLQKLTAKRGVQWNVCGVRFPRKPITVGAGAMGAMPVNIQVGDATITYATAQLVSHRDSKVYLSVIDGITPEVKVGGKVYSGLKPRKDRPFARVGQTSLYLLSSTDASMLHLDPEQEKEWGRVADYSTNVTFQKLKEAGPLRTITIGVCGASEEPEDKDFDDAAVYTIDIPADHSKIMQINYQGDCARLYVDGKLVQDNFYNGRPMLYGLWRLPEGARTMELRILPIQPDEPGKLVYFPREADTTPGEKLVSVKY